MFALIDEGREERRIAGGDKAFCINAVKFDVDNSQGCADQDLDEAIFRRVEIGGATSATLDFVDDMFVPPPTQ